MIIDVTGRMLNNYENVTIFCRKKLHQRYCPGDKRLHYHKDWCKKLALQKSCNSPFLKGYEGDTLSPPAGRQPKGSITLTPFSPSLPYLKKIFCQPPEGYRIFLGGPSGAEVKVTTAQKSVRTIFQ
jgi:hypothetical protein